MSHNSKNIKKGSHTSKMNRFDPSEHMQQMMMKFDNFDNDPFFGDMIGHQFGRDPM
jgi:hypothetical protein